MTTYTIYNWDISETTPPYPGAYVGAPKAPGDKGRQTWLIKLTDSEVVEMSKRYDVMLLSAWSESVGTRKHPKYVEHPPQIRLCEKGRRFRQY